jgi:hypothetical protein
VRVRVRACAACTPTTLLRVGVCALCTAHFPPPRQRNDVSLASGHGVPMQAALPSR